MNGYATQQYVQDEIGKINLTVDTSNFLPKPAVADDSGTWWLLGTNSTNNTNACDEIYITDHKLYTQTLIAMTIQIPTSSGNSVTGVGTANQILVTNGNAANNAYWGSLKTINGESILGSGNITISGGGSGGTSYTAGDGINITGSTISAYGIFGAKEQVSGTNYKYGSISLQNHEPILTIHNDATSDTSYALVMEPSYYTENAPYAEYNKLGAVNVNRETMLRKEGYFYVDDTDTQGNVSPVFCVEEEQEDGSYVTTTQQVSLANHSHDRVPLATEAEKLQFSEIVYQEEASSFHCKLACIGQHATRGQQIPSMFTSAKQSYHKD